MPKPTIDEVRSFDNLAMSYRWNMGFAQFPASVTPNITSAGLNLRCETATLPTKEMTTQTINIRGNKANHMGLMERTGEVTFTFFETVSHEVMAFLMAWEEKCFSTPEGTSDSKSNLQAIIEIDLLDNLDNATMKYTLVGCLLQGIEPGELGNENNFVKPKMKIKYDYFTRTMLT